MPVPKNGSKYNVEVCPPYQVAHTSCQAGKFFTGSKHRVTFGFGFANPDALSQGLTGPEARGEEHEVKLVWSHASGKRQVIADGQEVHFSVGKMLEPYFETSWTMEGGHTLKIEAHSMEAVFSTTTGFRQFELFLDGLSFFSMPSIYELGQKSQSNHYETQRTSQSKAKSAIYRRQDQQNSYSAPEGRDFAQAPTRASDNSRRVVTDDGSEPGKRLSSVASPAGVVDLPNAQALDLLCSDGQQQQDLIDSVVVVAAPQLHSSHDEFSPVEATPLSPSFSLATNQILSAYGPAKTNTPVGSELVPFSFDPHAAAPYYAQQQQTSSPHYNHYPHQPVVQQQFEAQPPVTPTHYYDPNGASYQTPTAHHQHQQQQYYQRPVVGQYQTPTMPAIAEEPSTPAVKLTMAPLTIEDIEDSRAPEITGMAKAVHSLVNLDDISEKLASPEDRKFQQKKQLAHRQEKSKPLPPKQPNWSLGLQPNLQAMKEHAPETKAPTREIMRPHAFDPNAVHAGMMVAYGTQPSLQPQQPMMMMHHGPSYYR